MASWAMPMSTVFSETWEFAMLPSVEPPMMSERLTKCWHGTFCSLHSFWKIAEETASVV